MEHVACNLWAAVVFLHNVKGPHLRAKVKGTDKRWSKVWSIPPLCLLKEIKGFS